MTKEKTTAFPDVWDAIEADRRRDRTLRRVATAAWTVTIVLVLVIGTMVGIQVYHMARGAMLGAFGWVNVIAVAMPLVIVLGILSVLVGTLSTIGMFLRMRTASLTEIQLRLAALESMLASGEGGRDAAATRG